METNDLHLPIAERRIRRSKCQSKYSASTLKEHKEKEEEEKKAKRAAKKAAKKATKRKVGNKRKAYANSYVLPEDDEEKEAHIESLLKAPSIGSLEAEDFEAVEVANPENAFHD